MWRREEDREISRIEYFQYQIYNANVLQREGPWIMQEFGEMFRVLNGKCM